MAARVLNQQREQLCGNVKFMFQPAEEGPGGALPMMKAGVLQAPKVDAAVALHLWNSLPMGKVGVRAGPIYAVSDEFILKIIGRGGHGANPHRTVDPIAVAAQVLTALQNIVSRRINPLKPAVVTIGRIEGGTRFNIIPDEVTMWGTVRAFETAVRDKIVHEIESIVGGVTSGFGARYELEHVKLYPATVNDKAMCEVVRAAAAEVVGRHNVIEQNLDMGGEDMSFVLQKVPGCYFVLGSSNKRKGLAGLHHSARFNFDEDALPIGIEVMTRIAKRYLSEG